MFYSMLIEKHQLGGAYYTCCGPFTLRFTQFCVLCPLHIIETVTTEVRCSFFFPEMIQAEPFQMMHIKIWTCIDSVASICLFIIYSIFM